VRVANPARGWFRRLEADPRAELIRQGTRRAVVAHPERSAEARAAIDRLFRAKYGLVDGWYGVLLRRGAVPVRLDPAPGGAQAAAAP
jgi:hypothetical protein